MLNKKLLLKYLLPFIFLVSLVATFGSLYFSEILKLPACSLCWYQRVFMYPIALISAVGLFRKDKNSIFYVLPLAIVGLGIAIYHNLLYYGIIPESAQPCTIGISCTIRQLEWFGLLSIPLLSLFAFIMITASSLLYLKISKKN
ncbi:MAG: putative disulfide formation protein [Microgenomates group bacterium GW2011_GWC1_38_14]|nr:MAG: putative disulfide formation protein [Candidatus Levybacteria bacterium GW2011_GWA2_36_13]KKQ00397.1 MAG: putative disulfide formation protein [Candidatus Levybacteria bacterium GW2011_GWB1_36_18]KKQ58172.1 MAG: putative disulfide formation protein [Microgenomates group bacterium GW2011_GWC1_38_14]KKR15607.1 MAG: putative disulfide formation protein [Candidatus Levybacteria bacterium GW2011_GWA1_39_32]OGH43507.1 MAG: hypothetical protein A3I49_00770 [Candidatus Levybacteria bacterium RI